MKEATGELNMTVITIIAIGAVLGFFWIMWNNVIKPQINNTWNESIQNKDNGFTPGMIIRDYEIIINK